MSLKPTTRACVITASGEQVLTRPVRNEETAIAGLFDEAAAHDTPALPVGTTSHDSSPAHAHRRPA